MCSEAGVVRLPPPPPPPLLLLRLPLRVGAPLLLPPVGEVVVGWASSLGPSSTTKTGTPRTLLLPWIHPLEALQSTTQRAPPPPPPQPPPSPYPPWHPSPCRAPPLPLSGKTGTTPRLRMPPFTCSLPSPGPCLPSNSCSTSSTPCPPKMGQWEGVVCESHPCPPPLLLHTLTPPPP